MFNKEYIMAKEINFKNKSILMIPDEDEFFNVYVSNSELVPFRKFKKNEYEVSIYVEEFPNGFGYGWSGNLIESFKTQSGPDINFRTKEIAYKKALLKITKYYLNNRYYIPELKKFIDKELKPKTLFTA